MKTFDLTPTNGRKSFNKKCFVNQYKNKEGKECSELISYGIKVAEYNHDTNEIKVFGYYSPTTQTHVNAFMEFYGFDKMSEKEVKELKVKSKKQLA